LSGRGGGGGKSQSECERRNASDVTHVFSWRKFWDAGGSAAADRPAWHR
jgi:hypothetical protein